MTDTSRFALAVALSAYGTIAASETDPWALLSQIEITETQSGQSYLVEKSFPLALRGGKTGFKITGLAVPYIPFGSPAGEVRELMLVSDDGVCPFCGSGEHGASLQVELQTPIAALEPGTRLSLQGDLEMIDDPETWQSAILRRAVLTSL